jgi:hypothetical protein
MLRANGPARNAAYSGRDQGLKLAVHASTFVDAFSAELDRLITLIVREQGTSSPRTASL